jgi:hypothetical protein
MPIVNTSSYFNDHAFFLLLHSRRGVLASASIINYNRRSRYRSTRIDYCSSDRSTIFSACLDNGCSLPLLPATKTTIHTNAEFDLVVS